MFTYRELLNFLRQYGPRPIMATDVSGVRPTKYIRESSFDLIVARLAELKDGPKRNWRFSIEVEPS